MGGQEAEWGRIQKALVTPAQVTVPVKKRRGRQQWMTEEIESKMDKRRKWKGINRERYQELDQ